MIAVDTNLLVYAHRADSEWHGAALNALVGLAESRSRWVMRRGALSVNVKCSGTSLAQPCNCRTLADR